MSLKKINDIKIKKIPKIQTSSDEKLPFKGKHMFYHPYSNVFLCSRKMSGKTTVVYNIIRECIDKNTKVIFFVSTFRADTSYASIEKYLKKHEIKYEAFDSIRDITYGISLLTAIIEEMKHEVEKENKVDDDDMDHFSEARYDISNEINGTIHIKHKHMTPKFLIIFDDISDEIKKDPTFIALLKKNRHLKSMIITSSQWFSDVLRGGRNNITVFILFQGIPDEILKEIYHSIALPLTFDKFKSLYYESTEEQYNFFYIDTNKGEYRKNFDTKFIL